MTQNSTKLPKMQELLARIEARKKEREAEATKLAHSVNEVVNEVTNSENYSAESAQSVGMHGEVIIYNSQQQQFINTAGAGESCILIGAAGTGKTTCSNGAIQKLISSGKVPILDSQGHKHLPSGTPGIVIVSFTKIAVNNIRKVVPEDLKGNCITLHKLLEFAPGYFEIEDEETGELKQSMRFLPTRHSGNPLPSSIHTVIFEEASMIGTELYNLYKAALKHKVQEIFIGDIQQLPPVFGPAILGFKMLELPTIELTEVYRQALESPIIRLAHRTLSGKAIRAEEYEEWKVENQLTIHPWKKKISADAANMTLKAFFTRAVDSGAYNPDEDMILIPYNKACGCIEINKIIANHLARKRNATTFEVMAGFNKHYFSVGDRILYDREDAEIVDIYPNKTYTGAPVQIPSKTLDYHGYNPNLKEDKAASKSYVNTDLDMDAILDAVAGADDRVTQASHVLVIQTANSGNTIEIAKAAEVNSLLLGYALTVHKSQGSEWRKVFFILHQTHATMLQRELLYTGITRAREELYIICEPESLTKGIVKQRIKGNTLEEKAEYFKGRVEAQNS